MDAKADAALGAEREQAAPPTRDEPAAVAALASALLRRNQPDAAFGLLARHDSLSHPVLHRLAARALLAMGRRTEAIGSLHLALALRPGDAETLGLLGDALFGDGRAAQALAPSLAAFDLLPSAAHATTLSCVLVELGRYHDARAVAGQGLRDDPGAAALWLNRSVAEEGLGRMDAATRDAREALRLAPHSPVSRHHLGATLLIQGSLTAEAWHLFDARLSLNGLNPAALDHRRWHGEDVAGRTVLLHAEQGFGDTLQFVRFVPLVAARAARVVLVVQPALCRLLAACPGADQVLAVGDPLPEFDVHAPLLSLPGLFATTLETIPPPLPYAIRHAPPAAGPLRVGLAWAGNPAFVADRARSLPPDALDTLAGVPGTEFHSLQVGPASRPGAIRFASEPDAAPDFADTAARVARLHLVVSADTAVAHLAATMGVPVWLLCRHRGCWRWLRDRDDSPWYPGLRILRQPHAGDWDAVLQEVRTGLGTLARQAGRPPGWTRRPALPMAAAWSEDSSIGP